MKKRNLFIVWAILFSAISAYFLSQPQQFDIWAVDIQTSQREIVPSNYIEPRFVDELWLGNIKDYSMVSKFWQNPQLNTSTYEDIWDGGWTYTYPADGTAPITHIVSDSTADTGTLEVQWLNISWYLVVQSKDLSWTNLVELDTPLWRVFRLKNEGTVDFVWQAEATDSGWSTTYAIIDNWNNQTLMALYTIPNWKIWLLLKWTNMISNTTRDVSIDWKLRVRKYWKVRQLKKTFWLDTEWTSYLVVENIVPSMLPPLADIRVDAIATSNWVALNTTFDIMLIDIE